MLIHILLLAITKMKINSKIKLPFDLIISIVQQKYNIRIKLNKV